MQTQTRTHKHVARKADGKQGAPAGPGLRSVLSRLPAVQQEVVVLRSYYGLSRAEIAAILGVPAARVGRLLWSAFRNLRHILKPPAPLAPAT